MPHGENHIHQRKRIHQLHQKYPHPNNKVRLLDNICMITAVVMPLTALPQVYKIWKYQIVAGVSIWMWISYNILIIPMLLYGIVHKVKQLVILNGLWILMDSFVIIGILKFS